MGAFDMCNEADKSADDLAECCPELDHLRSEVFRVMMMSLSKEQRLRFIALRLIVAGMIKRKRIAQHFGISLRTVYSWIALWRYEGLDAALDAAVAPKRRGGRLPRVYGNTLEALRAGLKEQRWKSASAVRKWLWDEHSVKLTLQGTYYWLRKVGTSREIPQSCMNE